MIISEGNTYVLEIPLTVNEEELDINDVSVVEFMFGNLRKVYGEEGDVTYDTYEKCFKVPLSQEETFALKGKNIIDYQARVKFKDDSVSGTCIYKGYVQETISKEVL